MNGFSKKLSPTTPCKIQLIINHQNILSEVIESLLETRLLCCTLFLSQLYSHAKHLSIFNMRSLNVKNISCQLLNSSNKKRLLLVFDCDNINIVHYFKNKNKKAGSFPLRICSSRRQVCYSVDMWPQLFIKHVMQNRMYSVLSLLKQFHHKAVHIHKATQRLGLRGMMTVRCVSQLPYPSI